MNVEDILNDGLSGIRETSRKYADEVMRQAGLDDAVVNHFLGGSFMAGAVWMLQSAPDADQELVQKIWDKMTVVLQDEYNQILETQS